VEVDGTLVGDYCGLIVTYDSQRGWREESDSLGGWLVSLVEADDTALLFARNLETSEQTLLAFRPPEK
jgi:beta-lactamase class D